MNTQTTGSVAAGTPTNIQQPERVKYVLYARKSTEQDEKQALSIDSQVKEMLRIAERDGLEIVDIRREAHSAKDSGQRPVYNEILRDIIDDVNLNGLGVTMQCEAEIARLKNLSVAMGKEGTIDLDPNKIDPKSYAKHLLKNGSSSEKRILLSNLRSMLIYKNRTIEVAAE